METQRNAKAWKSKGEVHLPPQFEDVLTEQEGRTVDPPDKAPKPTAPHE